MLRFRILGALAFVTVLVAAVAVGLLVWTERSGLSAVQAHWASLEAWLLIGRIAAFAVLLLYWRELVALLGRGFDLDLPTRESLVRWRPRAAIGLFVMDLVLVEDALGRIVRALS